MRRAATAGERGSARELLPVGSVLEQVLGRLKLDERFRAAEATERWAESAGPEILARTRCVGVRDGELLIEVQGAVWMGHLAVLRQGIMDRINEALPAERRLRAIRLTPMRSKEEKT